MEKLLKLLADKETHSGDEIGMHLNISRTAVWKKIKGLRALGLLIDAIRGKGYRLSRGVELLDDKKISAFLNKEALQKASLHLCSITTSTNDFAHQVATKVSDEKIHFCMAEHQTSGRGRRGRSWSTPFGGTICLSVLWKRGNGMASLEGLSLAVGLTVLQALQFCGANDLGLKWPNDILWQGKKLSGILLEVHGDLTGECEVVIGIGVNIKLDQHQINNIDQPAVDLHQACNGAVSRNNVVGTLINMLCHMLERYQQGGFSLFRQQWNQYDAFLGQQVTLDISGNTTHGRAQGVNERGALILETKHGQMYFYGGEVSLHTSAFCKP